MGEWVRRRACPFFLYIHTCFILPLYIRCINACTQFKIMGCGIIQMFCSINFIFAVATCGKVFCFLEDAFGIIKIVKAYRGIGIVKKGSLVDGPEQIRMERPELVSRDIKRNRLGIGIFSQSSKVWGFFLLFCRVFHFQKQSFLSFSTLSSFSKGKSRSGLPKCP